MSDQDQTNEDRIARQRALGISQSLVGLMGVAGMAAMYMAFSSTGSGFSRVACEIAPPVPDTSPLASRFIAVLIFSLPMWAGLFLSEMKARRYRYWFYGFAGLYTVLACLFIHGATSTFRKFSDYCGPEFPEISALSALKGGAILALITGIILAVLFGVTYVIKRKTAGTRFAGFFTPRIAKGLFGAAIIAASGAGLAKRDAGNKKTVQNANDQIVLMAMVKHQENVRKNPALLLSGASDLEQHVRSRAKREKRFELRDIRIEDEHLHVSIAGRLPLLPGSLWKRDYNTSAAIIIPRPNCETTEAHGMDVPCVEPLSPIAG